MLDSSPPSRAFILTFLLVLLVIAAYIRIDGAGIYHVSPDELNHIEMAQGHDLSEVLKFSHYETHPPLGHLIRHFWMQISGATWFLRAMSLLFCLPLVPLYYLIGERLAGRWAGLCGAFLAAFSFGCIIQSYVIRNYSILLFFISVVFYAWLRWREGRDGRWLAVYAAAGSFAVLTHFSGILAAFCIAAVETLHMLRRRQALRQMAPWVLANLLVAGIAMGTFYLWYPLLQSMRMDTDVPSDWLYPAFVLNYLLFFHANVMYVFALFGLFALGLYETAMRLPALRLHVLLTVFALLVATVLLASGLYITGMNRHSLWLFPFVISSVACALSLLCGRLKPFLPDAAIGGLLLAAGIALYNPVQRFSDILEYLMTESTWKEYVDYLGSLDRSHLILTITTNDAFITAYPDAENLYDFYYPAHFKKYNFASDYAGFFVPFHQTLLYFKPYYTDVSPLGLVTSAEEALADRRTGGMQTLAFVSSHWSRHAFLGLLSCRSLDKEIRVFPPLAAGKALDKETLASAPIVIMTLSKSAFVSELAAPNGKARACLSQPPS